MRGCSTLSCPGGRRGAKGLSTIYRILTSTVLVQYCSDIYITRIIGIYGSRYCRIRIRIRIRIFPYNNTIRYKQYIVLGTP